MPTFCWTTVCKEICGFINGGLDINMQNISSICNVPSNTTIQKLIQSRKISSRVPKKMMWMCIEVIISGWIDWIYSSFVNKFCNWCEKEHGKMRMEDNENPFTKTE